jgi:predicted DNA-binding protein
MARDRKGAQLALELEPQLMQRLRARAAADGRPVAVLVRRWIEAGLGGALEQQGGAAAA